MNSQYAVSVGMPKNAYDVFFNNTMSSTCNLDKLDQVIDNLHQREVQIFQRIVNSIKFDDDEYASIVLAREIAQIRILGKKLCAIKAAFHTMSDNHESITP